MGERLSANQVFTPTQPATYTFVERDKTTTRRIEQALLTPGLQIVLFGSTGTGKTTLIRNKLEQLGPDRTVTCRCTTSTTFDEIVNRALSQIEAMYTAEESTATSGRRSLKFDAPLVGGSITLQGSQPPGTVKRSVASLEATVEAPCVRIDVACTIRCN